jgi:hypothetical protein
MPSAFDTDGVWQSDSLDVIKKGPFPDLQSQAYWSGTRWPWEPDKAYLFCFYNDSGAQGAYAMENQYYALAVHDGNVANDHGKPPHRGLMTMSVPVASTPILPTWMLVSLGIPFVAWARRRMK